MYSISTTNKTPISFETWSDVLEFLDSHDCSIDNTLIFKNEYLFASYCYPDLTFNLHSLEFVDNEFPDYAEQIKNLKQGVMDISKNNITSLITKNYKYYCVDNYPIEGVKQEEVLKILSLSFFIDRKDNFPLIFAYHYKV
jgi:hypothetical protein